MNPNLLKQLAIVVKQGSITSACEQLHITQPTLSRSIGQLEEKVGAPLLKRTRYGVIPTEIGVRLSQIGERILHESIHAEEIIRQFHSGYKTEFIIGVDPLWEFATVAKMTQYFLKEKRYAFHFRTGPVAALISLLDKGKIDFLLGPAQLSVAHSKLDRQILFRDRSAIFAGKKSKLLFAKGPIAKDLVASQNWIIAGANAGFLESQGELAGNKAASMAYTGSICSVLHLLKSSDMLVRLPARLTLMTDDVEHKQMLEVPGISSARRDIALWSCVEHNERPDIIKVQALIGEFVTLLDREEPIFGLKF